MKRIATLVTAVALIVPSSAFAQSGSTCQTYNPQLCSVTTGTSASQGTDPSGTLPFTGVDVPLLAAAGLSLVGGGVFVRRLSRRPN